MSFLWHLRSQFWAWHYADAEALGMRWLRVFDARGQRDDAGAIAAVDTVRWWRDVRRERAVRADTMVETHDTLLAALRADNYAGPLSLEWEKMWHPYLAPVDDALAIATVRGWWRGAGHNGHPCATTPLHFTGAKRAGSFATILFEASFSTLFVPSKDS